MGMNIMSSSTQTSARAVYVAVTEPQNYKGVLTMKVKLDSGARLPQRAHDADVGYDLYARKWDTVPAHGSAVFDTGVHIELPANVAGLLVSKSGLNVNHGLTSEGLIDPGFTGSIHVKLYNNTDDDYTVRKGDKISQLLLVPCLTPDLELVDELAETERSDRGFGSTGR
jgi:dUTP pyrophosphatase